MRTYVVHLISDLSNKVNNTNTTLQLKAKNAQTILDRFREVHTFKKPNLLSADNRHVA